MKRARILVAAGVLAAAVVAAGVAAGDGPAGPRPQDGVNAAAPEAAKAPASSPAATDKHIDLVICLDTSGSMGGLIESAKQKLWAVVNELATAKPRPRLRVALYHYGNNGLKQETGWVDRLCPLTDDLDTVYSKLFALRTNGGTEYVARVIKAATEELEWNRDRGTLRVIFVAGNEPATQDKANPLQEVCQGAATKGIIINTIFCGREEEGRRSGWEDAARWADGRYAAIDQDRGTVAITTPHDARLAELGAELNKTYVAYGRGGAAGASLQTAMDGKAAAVNAPAAAERTVAKASGLYRNAAWDLVDAAKDNKVDLAKLGEAELPEEMKNMTPQQRKEHIAAKARQREELQKEIQTLNQKRQDYIKEQLAKQGLGDKSDKSGKSEKGDNASFDAALRAAVREQAAKKEFRFEEGK